MICTQEDAKTKLCPYRMSFTSPFCQVTDCMFWRHEGVEEEEVWVVEELIEGDTYSERNSNAVKYAQARGLRHTTTRGDRDGVPCRKFYRKTGKLLGACGAAERDVSWEAP